MSSPRNGRDPLELHRIGWVDLPGRSMYLRCLSVLAIHWFGSTDMVPRVRGAPLWRSLRAEMSTPSAGMNRLKFDIQVVGDTSATLRYQFRRDLPLIHRTVALDALDADPLRALIRVGLGRVRPMAEPRKPVSQRVVRQASPVDVHVHASAQRA